jgi:hypothetical protein
MRRTASKTSAITGRLRGWFVEMLKKIIARLATESCCQSGRDVLETGSTFHPPVLRRRRGSRTASAASSHRTGSTTATDPVAGDTSVLPGKAAVRSLFAFRDLVTARERWLSLSLISFSRNHGIRHG